MATAAPYQRLCLHTLKPRRTISVLTGKRHNSTTTTSTLNEKQQPQSTIEGQPPPPHADPTATTSTSDENITTFLQAADTQKLNETLTQLTRLHTTVNDATTLLQTTLQTSSTINLIPEIPPYTPAHPRKLQIAHLTPTLTSLQSHLTRLRANFTDLLSVPYPAPSPGEPTRSEKFLNEVQYEGAKAQREMLQTFRYEQLGQKRRMGMALEKLEEEVRRLESLNGQNRMEREDAVAITGRRRVRRGGAVGTYVVDKTKAKAKG